MSTADRFCFRKWKLSIATKLIKYVNNKSFPPLLLFALQKSICSEEKVADSIEGQMEQQDKIRPRKNSNIESGLEQSYAYVDAYLCCFDSVCFKLFIVVVTPIAATKWALTYKWGEKRVLSTKCGQTQLEAAV